MFLLPGGCRERVVHTHHLHCSFPGKCQPRHRQEKPGIPRSELAHKFSSKEPTSQQKISQQSARHSGGNRRGQQPRHQHIAHSAGPQQPTQDESREGDVHQRDHPPGAQPDGRRRQTGADHWSLCGAAPHGAPRHCGGVTGAVQAGEKRRSQQFQQRRAHDDSRPWQQ